MSCYVLPYLNKVDLIVPPCLDAFLAKSPSGKANADPFEAKKPSKLDLKEIKHSL
jgi:hypothetical protein